MADQWEMCGIGIDFVTIRTPQKAERIRTEEFVKRQKATVTEQFYDAGICLLLSDGWEPYARDGSRHFFRRKYQG